MDGGWWDVLFGGLGGVVIGVVGGVYGTYWYTLRLDRIRRKQEAADVTVSLYHEVADRAARSLNDYLEPWRRFTSSPLPSEAMTIARVLKFRPAEPVVYPSLAAKLGLIEAKALAPTLHFYFRLDALRRDIGNLSLEGPATDLMASNEGHERVQRMAQRLGETLEPALRALEALDVPRWQEIDAQTSAVYPHVANYGKSLREGLREMAAFAASRR